MEVTWDEIPSEARDDRAIYFGAVEPFRSPGSPARFPYDLLTFGFIGRLRITRGTDSLFVAADGSPAAADVALLTALFGLREAVERATIDGPQIVNCPPNFFDLFVVDNPPNGVWVSAVGNRDKLRAPASEWLEALDTTLADLRVRLQREIPELAEDQSFGEWIIDGSWPQIASELSRPGGV